jgi:hypothetical protein
MGRACICTAVHGEYATQAQEAAGGRLFFLRYRGLRIRFRFAVTPLLAIRRRSAVLALQSWGH